MEETRIDQIGGKPLAELLPFWTAKIGPKTAQSFRLLRNSTFNHEVFQDGCMLMDSITVDTGVRSVDLYKATVADLGFAEDAIWAEIRSRLDELGFGNCPPEVMPNLYSGYVRDKPDNHLVMVMEPVNCPDGRGRVFYIGGGGRISSRWIDAMDGNPNHLLSRVARLVFCRKPA